MQAGQARTPPGISSARPMLAACAGHRTALDPEKPHMNADPGAAETSSYREAGVDISAGAQISAMAGDCAAITMRPEVLSGPGGFAALCGLPRHYQEPVLVCSTDGVGTKLCLAAQCGVHDTTGIDLVAMCVNDVLACGGEPLLFLDYYAASELEPDASRQLLEGIARGCRLAGCALVGGETAQMPGLYRKGDYDVAGFCVGVAERGQTIDGSRARPGDALIALASSGAHSNGYSLIRQIVASQGLDLRRPFDASGLSLQEALLAPTRIYVRAVLGLIRETPVEVRAIAHITGGGVMENLPRVLPDGVQARLYMQSWRRSPILDFIQEQGQLPEREMWHTFNCGAGMLLCVPADQAEQAIQELEARGEQAWLAGHLDSRAGGEEPVVLVEEARGR